MTSIMDYRGAWPGAGIDMSDTIIHAATDEEHEGEHYCICGGNLWHLVVSFSDYEIAVYATDMECLECGTRAKAPTPIDKPGYKPDSLTF